MENVYKHLGFQPKDSDTSLDIHTRTNVLKYACKFGQEQCVKEARTEFDKFMKDEKYQ